MQLFLFPYIFREHFSGYLWRNVENCCYVCTDGKSVNKLRPANAFDQSGKSMLMCKWVRELSKSVLQPFWNDVCLKLFHPWHCGTALSGCSCIVRPYNIMENPKYKYLDWCLSGKLNSFCAGPITVHLVPQPGHRVFYIHEIAVYWLNLAFQLI